MKIRRKVREYAAPANVAEEKALAVEMAEKSKQFVETGAVIYPGNKPAAAGEHL